MKVKITKHHDHTRAILLDELDETTYRRFQRIMAHAARGIAYDGGQTRLVATVIDNTITPENAKKPGVVTQSGPVLGTIYLPTATADYEGIDPSTIQMGVVGTASNSLMVNGLGYPVIDPATTQITKEFANSVPKWTADVPGDAWVVGVVARSDSGVSPSYFICSRMEVGSSGKPYPWWTQLTVVDSPTSTLESAPSYYEWSADWANKGFGPVPHGTRVTFKKGSRSGVMYMAADGLWHWEEDNTVV